MAKPFHLGWFLNGTSVPAWNAPFSGAIGTQWQQAEIFVDLARAMERACFDYVLIEDNTFVGDRYGDSMEIYLKHAFQAPRQDPMVVATLLAQATSHLGIIATAGTFAYHPFMLARLSATIDQVSGGRMGVNFVTGTSDRALQNYGQPGMAEHDERYDIAEDFLQATTALWDTWDADAVIADHESGYWAVHEKVRRADYVGPYYATRGPLNTGPSPQGRPVVAQAGGSPRGIDFAARYADTVVAIHPTASKMTEYREKVHAAALHAGRKPDDVKVLFGIGPIVAATEREAQERIADRKAEMANGIEVELAKLAKSTDIDFAQVPLDVPLGELALSTNGTQQFAEFAQRNADKTLREAVLGRGIGNGAMVAGTPGSVADQLEEIMETVGGDGFLISTNGVTRRFIAEICDGLVPELQRRGLTRDRYAHTQLRDNLLEF